MPSPSIPLAVFVAAAALVSTSPPLPDVCRFDNAYGAGPPPYYVNYKLQSTGSTPPVIDGSLDDAAWNDVAFTVSNPDICGTAAYCSTAGNCAKGQKPEGCATPRFTTRQKMRWDDEFLYVGAELEEPQVHHHSPTQTHTQGCGVPQGAAGCGGCGSE